MDKNIKRLSEEEINEKIKLFKQNPKEYNAILSSLLLNQSTVDLSLFKKNIKFIAQKILSITRKTHYDMYQAYSCIYGAFLGDAMGSYCEFTKYNLDNYKSIFEGLNVFNFEAGQITDDSEMALSMAYAIMDSRNPKELNQSILYFYYGIWKSTSPFDIGRTTSSSLRHFNLNSTAITEDAFSTYKTIISTTNENSLSNGFLMRLSPFVVWYYYINKTLIKEVICNNTYSQENYSKLYNSIKDTVKLDNQMTHWNPEVYSASAVFVFIALCAISGLNSKEILAKLDLLLSDEGIFMNCFDKKTKDHVQTALAEFSKKTFSVEAYMKIISKQHIGYYLHAFNLTLYYLYFFDNIKPYNSHTTVYRQIMNEINNWGGDTDTNAAIVGTVLGPIIGFSNFGLKDLTIFLNYYSHKRYAYSSAFIYFFIQFLESPDCNSIATDIKFNFIHKLLSLLNSELS